MTTLKSRDFLPPRQRGASIHSTLIAALALIMVLATWLATNTPIGPRFTFYVLIAALAFAPLPVLAYRLYALQHGFYRIDRDKLTIVWGLRSESIPISDIEWVRPLTALHAPLPLPPFRLPGSLLGYRRVADLGTVEFLAAETDTLLLVATRQRIFAISPADPVTFVQDIQSTMEMGSLSPALAESVYPSFIIGEAWQDPLARFLWLGALFLNIGLLIWVSLIIPSLNTVPLGFLSSGVPGEAVPAAGLILLPAISIFLSALGWVVGLVFYRRAEQQALARILWLSNVITSILFLIAILFLISTS